MEATKVSRMSSPRDTTFLSLGPFNWRPSESLEFSALVASREGEVSNCSRLPLVTCNRSWGRLRIKSLHLSPCLPSLGPVLRHPFRDGLAGRGGHLPPSFL